MVQQLKAVRLHEGFALLRVAGRHFFMSGTSEQLATGAASLLQHNRNDHDLVKKCILLLLESQYARSRQHGDLLFRVQQRSGMGLARSSAVADACFAAHHETDLNFAAAGLEFYARYKDDLLMVVNDRTRIREWYHQRRDLLGYISMKVEEYSSHSVRMLQLELRPMDRPCKYDPSSRLRP